MDLEKHAKAQRASIEDKPISIKHSVSSGTSLDQDGKVWQNNEKVAWKDEYHLIITAQSQITVHLSCNMYCNSYFTKYNFTEYIFHMERPAYHRSTVF